MPDDRLPCPPARPTQKVNPQLPGKCRGVFVKSRLVAEPGEATLAHHGDDAAVVALCSLTRQPNDAVQAAGPIPRFVGGGRRTRPVQSFPLPPRDGSRSPLPPIDLSGIG